MPKTTFVNGVTVVTADFLNSLYGVLNGHDHRAEDRDGSAPKIELDELEDSLRNMINDLIALRPAMNQLIYKGMNRASIFGGTGKDGAFIGNHSLDNPVYEFTDFSIPAGSTVNANRGAVWIKCTGTVTIEGDLIAKPICQYGFGSGWYSSSGNVYNYLSSPIGSGGSEAVDHTDIAGLQVLRDPGGAGGSAIIIEALGEVIISGNVDASGSDAKASQIISGSNHIIGGSGGGSGGSIIVQSFTSINMTGGKLKVKGGRGGDGIGTNAAAGGGGGGGWARIIAPSIVGSIAANIDASGGQAGLSAGVGSNLGGGGGSFGGKGGASKAAGQTGIGEVVPAQAFSWM